MASLPSPLSFDAQTDFLPLFHREGCSFLIHSLTTTLLAETKWGPVRRPHIKEPERRKKYAARDANEILESLVADGLLLKATTWLSGADLLTTRLFPDGDET